MSADAPLGPSIPAPLTDDEDQTEALRSILPNPAERTVTAVLCKSCGQIVGTVRRVASPSCPLVWVGTRRAKDLIDYDVARSVERDTTRRRITSASTYSVALGIRSTPPNLPVRCDQHGDGAISAGEVLTAARAERAKIRVRLGQR